MPGGLLVVDNGGYSIKAWFQPASGGSVGVSSNSSSSGVCVCIPNAVGASPSLGRGLIGSQLTALPHYHSLMLRRPLERGLLVDAELQAAIWDDLLTLLGIGMDDEASVDVIVTVPHGGMAPIVAEQWGALLTVGCAFRSVTLVSPSLLALIGASQWESTTNTSSTQGGTGPGLLYGTALVADFGFSGTTITPYVDFRPCAESIVRLEVGGKLLTNRLKEVISFSQVNLLEDTWLVNVMKEACCCVCSSATEVLLRSRELKRRGTKRLRDEPTNGQQRPTLPRGGGDYYVLPTIAAAMPVGCILPPNNPPAFKEAQMVRFAHEAFVVPELLFTPADVGIASQGVTEALKSLVHPIHVDDVIVSPSIKPRVPQHAVMAPQLLRCAERVVVPFGGVVNTPGLRERLWSEFRTIASDDAPQVKLASGPPSADVGSLLPAPLHTKSMKTASATDWLPVVGASFLFRAHSKSSPASPALVSIREALSRRSRVALRLDVPLAGENKRRHIADQLMRAAEHLL